MARKELFTKKGRPIENIPPTKGALIQHIKRAVLQGGHSWGNLSQTSLELPSPEEWGWRKDNDGSWTPLWTQLPDAS